CDDSWHQSNPIPGNAGRVIFALVAPQGLAGARAAVVTEVEYARAQVGEMKLGRAAGLPQYGRPRTDDPGRSHGGRQVDGELLIEQSVAPVWQGPRGLPAVRVVRVAGWMSRC